MLKNPQLPARKSVLLSSRRRLLLRPYHFHRENKKYRNAVSAVKIWHPRFREKSIRQIFITIWKRSPNQRASIAGWSQLTITSVVRWSPVKFRGTRDFFGEEGQKFNRGARRNWKSISRGEGTVNRQEIAYMPRFSYLWKLENRKNNGPDNVETLAETFASLYFVSW